MQNLIYASDPIVLVSEPVSEPVRYFSTLVPAYIILNLWACWTRPLINLNFHFQIEFLQKAKHIKMASMLNKNVSCSINTSLFLQNHKLWLSPESVLHKVVVEANDQYKFLLMSTPHNLITRKFRIFRRLWKHWNFLGNINMFLTYPQNIPKLCQIIALASHQILYKM